MTVPMLNLLYALLDIVFVFATGLTALTSLLYARWDHGFQRIFDVAFALFAGYFAWSTLPGIQQSFDRVGDPRLQSVPINDFTYLGLIFWTLVTVALFAVSLRTARKVLHR